MVTMQAMWKKFIILSFVVVLGSCSGAGYSPNPWSGGGYISDTAEEPPRPLTANQAADGEGEGDYSHVINGQAVNGQGSGEEIEIAGLEFVPRDGAASQDPSRSGYESQPYTGQRETPSTPAMKPIKVALLVPLSGPHKDLGQALLQASQMAMFDMDFPAIEIVPRDTAANPDTARQAAQSAIQDGAQLILGPLFSSSVSAVKPVARRSNVNVIAFSTDWALAGDNTYIMGFLPFAQVQRVTEYAMMNGYNNIGILAPNTDYGSAVIAAYNSMTYRSGLPRADIARFSGDDNAISEVIRHFTNFDQRELAREEGEEPEIPFDAILMPVGGDQARSISNLLSYYDLDEDTVKRLGTGLWDDSGLAAEESMNYAWFAAPSPDLRTGFENRFAQLYGYQAPRLSTLAYDATALAIVLARKASEEGILQAGYGRESMFVHSQITNPNGFAGIDGIFRFRPDNLVERGLAVLEIRDGDIEIIDPAPTTFQKRQSY